MHDFHGTFRDLLHAANLRHGTYGFTSLPKEGVLRIFFALKIRRLRPRLNSRTSVLKASTLPLDHWSRYIYIYLEEYMCWPKMNMKANLELNPQRILFENVCEQNTRKLFCFFFVLLPNTATFTHQQGPIFAYLCQHAQYYCFIVFILLKFIATCSLLLVSL